MMHSVTVRNGSAQVVRYGRSDLTGLSYETANLRSREGFRETMVPLQMVLISYEKGTPEPYRISFFSPGIYQYFQLDEETFDSSIRRSDLHTHNTYEFALVREGTLLQRIESERHMYPQGSCFLLNRNVRHNEEYESSFCTVTLSVSGEFLSQTLKEEFPDGYAAGSWGEGTDLAAFLNAELNGGAAGRKTYIDFIPAGDGREMSDLYDRIALALLDPGPGSVFLIKNLLCRILHLLTRKDLFSTVPVEVGTAAEGRVFAEIADAVEKAKGRVNRQELAGRLHYSGNYLNRLTKKFTGMNLTEYAASVAMRHAADMLLNTRLTVSGIADELAFSNRRSFYKAFEKVYGVTPRQYRLEHADR